MFTGYNGPAGESLHAPSDTLLSGGAYQSYKAMRHDSFEGLEHVVDDPDHQELNEKLQAAIAVRDTCMLCDCEIIMLC